METTINEALFVIFVAFATPFAFTLGCLAAAQVTIWMARWNNRPKGDWK